MKDKLLFILPGRPDLIPYVYNYFKKADECGRQYDVVCWNRLGEDVSVFPANYMVYNHPTSDHYSSLKKIQEIFGFYQFVRRSIGGRHYSVILTFTIADSLFFSPWLTSHYRGRYIFDIRDYSPLVDSFVSRWLVRHMLKYSAVNVISSEGFRSWLPVGYDYCVCHNSEINVVRQCLSHYDKRIDDGIIRVLTIGNIRDAESNIKVVDSLGNKDGVQLEFAGDGKTARRIKEHYEKKGYCNVSFLGRYRKEEEDDIVKRCDIINIVLPHNKISDHLMSNRFYLSARMRKPMVVNEGSFQAEMVRKYGLGLVVYIEDDIYTQIKNYWSNMNWTEYDENCRSFLRKVLDDMIKWEARIKDIMSK